MKVGKTKLRMSSGEVRQFGSEKKRDDFERVAEAIKHGWKPTHRAANGMIVERLRTLQRLGRMKRAK